MAVAQIIIFSSAYKRRQLYCININDVKYNTKRSTCALYPYSVWLPICLLWTLRRIRPLRKRTLSRTRIIAIVRRRANGCRRPKCAQMPTIAARGRAIWTICSQPSATLFPSVTFGGFHIWRSATAAVCSHLLCRLQFSAQIQLPVASL